MRQRHWQVTQGQSQQPLAHAPRRSWPLAPLSLASAAVGLSCVHLVIPPPFHPLCVDSADQLTHTVAGQYEWQMMFMMLVASFIMLPFIPGFTVFAK